MYKFQVDYLMSDLSRAVSLVYHVTITADVLRGIFWWHLPMVKTQHQRYSNVYLALNSPAIEITLVSQLVVLHA